MAGWALKLGAVVGVAALGAAAGFAGGQLANPADSHPKPMTSDPLAAVPSIPSTSPSPTAPTTPAVTRTPVPDDTEPLRADDLEYGTVEASLKLKESSETTAHVTAEVPIGWEYTDTKDHPDWAVYKDASGKRRLRIESGFTVQRPTTASLEERIAKLKALDPNQLLKISSSTTVPAQGVDGEERTFSTLTYTYLPPSGINTLYVIVRWIGFDDGRSAVEMAAVGLPQDAKALEAVLDRASKSVTRDDR